MLPPMSADRQRPTCADACPTGSRRWARTHYVVNRMMWPTTSNEARADAFDLDGDSVVDNQLGMVIASLHGQGFDVQTPTDQAIARGTSITLADLAATDLYERDRRQLHALHRHEPEPDAVQRLERQRVRPSPDRHRQRSTPPRCRATRRSPARSRARSSRGGPGHLTVPLYVLTGMPAVDHAARRAREAHADGRRGHDRHHRRRGLDDRHQHQDLSGDAAKLRGGHRAGLLDAREPARLRLRAELDRARR